MTGLPVYGTQLADTKNGMGIEKIESITIKNSITPPMLEYTWLKKVYKPEFFTLRVNGKPLKPGASLSIPITDNKLTVRYDYSFVVGWWFKRNGANEIIFKLNPTKKEYDLSFSWQNEFRVIIPDALAQKKLPVTFSA